VRGHGPRNKLGCGEDESEDRHRAARGGRCFSLNLGGASGRRRARAAARAGSAAGSRATR
jgi:hypothetical protein